MVTTDPHHHKTRVLRDQFPVRSSHFISSARHAPNSRGTPDPKTTDIGGGDNVQAAPNSYPPTAVTSDKHQRQDPPQQSGSKGGFSVNIFCGCLNSDKGGRDSLPAPSNRNPPVTVQPRVNQPPAPRKPQHPTVTAPPPVGKTTAPPNRHRSGTVPPRSNELAAQPQDGDSKGWFKKRFC